MFFKTHIMGPMQSEMVKPPPPIKENSDSTPRSATPRELKQDRFLSSFMKQPPKNEPVFQCIADMRDQVKKILWDNFEELREFYLELAALDSYAFPHVSLNKFAMLCAQLG